MVQPPALRAADPEAWIRRLVVEDVDRDDLTRLGGCDQSGLVVEAKVLPEPQDRRCDWNSPDWISLSKAPW